MKDERERGRTTHLLSTNNMQPRGRKPLVTSSNSLLSTSGTVGTPVTASVFVKQEHLATAGGVVA